VFSQGNGSAGVGALKWSLVGGNGDPQLYVELAGGSALDSTLAEVNKALGLVASNQSAVIVA
jgi:hypothetical protein